MTATAPVSAMAGALIVKFVASMANTFPEEEKSPTSVRFPCIRVSPLTVRFPFTVFCGAVSVIPSLLMTMVRPFQFSEISSSLRIRVAGWG